MLIFLVACHPDPPPDTTHSTPVPVPSPVPYTPDLPTFTSGPLILLPVAPTVRLVERLVASTDRPTRATLVVDDGIRAREIAFPELATDHDLAILALREQTSYTVEATFTDADDLSVVATLGFETTALDGAMPELDIVHSEPTRSESGYTLLPAEIGEEESHVLAIDDSGHVVGTWDTHGYSTRALMFVDGVFSSLIADSVVRWTPVGDVVGTWAAAGGAIPDAVVLPIDGLHHEVAFEPDGTFWTFHKIPFPVPDYPTTEDDPFTTAPALIDGDVAMHFAVDGTVLQEWRMVDRLDTNRIGYGSLAVNAGVDGHYDWAHANAIVPLPDQGAVLISLRHQDAIVKLSLPDGELQWILGNPDGWDPEFQPYLLQPVGDLQWAYHQHGPMVGPDGRIVMFDNGNDHRTTPYSQDPSAALYSRVVQFEVDEVAHTVSQTFSSIGTQEPNGGYLLYSQALGNADILPSTGNVLATFSYLHEENGIRNQDINRGDKSVRVVEIDMSTGDTVWDLRLYTPSAFPAGLLTDRAIRVPSLYPSTVTERWLP